MTNTQTTNDVVIRRKPDGGMELLLNGFDLATCVDSWSIAPETYASGTPVLTVAIPCEHLTMTVGPEVR